MRVRVRVSRVWVRDRARVSAPFAAPLTIVNTWTCVRVRVKGLRQKGYDRVRVR